MDLFEASVVWVFVMLLFCSQADANCSWSNEDCSADKDCCSLSCHKAHEGTNARCRHSMLGEPCVFDYHCQDGLTCGAHYNCCSPYWKMCITDADCCDPTHVCKPAEGFYYDRCLMRSSATSLRKNTSCWTLLLFLLPFTFTVFPRLHRSLISQSTSHSTLSFLAVLTTVLAVTSLVVVA